MAKTEAKPIRFSDAQDAILKKVASLCGVKEADVARWAVEALGDYFTHHGQRLLLPLRFHETFSVTTIDPSKPLTLFEPPSRIRSEVVRSEARNKTKTGAR